MTESKLYSARNVFEGLKKTFHQYIEAQYHIWDEGLIAERKCLLEQPGVSFQEPRLEATPFYANGNPYDQLLISQPAQEILKLASSRPKIGIYSEPYVHQAKALEAFLGRGEDIVVATGTGSGKTESFLMPILGSLAFESAHRSDSWKVPGVRALLLYPMNALVNDQLARLRRLLGDTEVAKRLKGKRDRRATFGMYTSRTPYPGMSTTAKDKTRIGELLKKLYQGLSVEARTRLEREGKWPAKDIERFIESFFTTGPEDSELFSREEMQKVCPDLLVTNYSMLEYMLLRPIERSIFEQTAQWLKCNAENRFIVVLDEAHVYRGSGGAEVAYLLRRLHSRLGVSRDRVGYILTSASLGSSPEAERRIKLFATDLTGLDHSRRSFTLITGELDKKPGERVAKTTEQRALSEYDLTTLHKIYEAVGSAQAALRDLFAKLGTKFPEVPLDEGALRNIVYDWLRSFGPASLAANLITSRPQKLSDIARLIFSSSNESERALESLLALMSFAREKNSDRVFAPVRSHLFFRGLPGLFVCVNPQCSGRVDMSKVALLGRVFSSPKLRCECCGSRVYELLTHRDCGAAFIRGYLRDQDGDFLWHEPSIGLWSTGGLLESHFLVEVDRRSHQASGKAEGNTTWLHIETGKLEVREPLAASAQQYIALLRPDGLVTSGSGKMLSFNGECPVCVRRWQGTSKIMDLMTKGEAPFAHLVRQQVALQPAVQPATEQSPNGGRKALLFSDGRQKAARLARDIPREIEQDVFRQVLLLAATELKRVGLEPVLNHWIYVAFLDILAKTGLQFFDGEDRHALRRDVRDYRKWHDGDLVNAIREFGSAPPPRFTALLHRQLGSRFYSVNALTLAYIGPTQRALRAIIDTYTRVDKDIALALSIIWVQGFANEFAFDPNVKLGIRQQAAGYPLTPGLDAKGGFSKRQQQFLIQRLGEIDSLTSAFAEMFCQPDARGALFLAPKQLKLDAAVQSIWYQCLSCTAVSPVAWWRYCPNCVSAEITEVKPGATTYLRARKAFWREPVVRALAGDETPLNMTVEEHTAQLSYRDVDEPNPTTEEFERRFRDILVRSEDTSIDVLSSTTTMEVGIDIGSLVAVGLRNVPPLRQNYQQRAGRAGRRGSAISTVLTYAQNNPHDSHYFENPERIIGGEPALPGVDTKNVKIVERHVRAQLIQVFFHSKNAGVGSSNIFTMLGETWEFYTGQGEFSLYAFRNWITNSPEVNECYRAIREWLPKAFNREPAAIAEDFLSRLEEVRPRSQEQIDQSNESLIEFLFSHGFLPSYAFPRDLCALQIEEERPGPGKRVRVIQRPQQGLNIALSEYAPGRIVVVDKKTYRVGTVAAGGMATVVDRADRLFTGRRVYVHCNACFFTAGFLNEFSDGQQCPLCQSGQLSAVTVIQPEVVYPDGGREVDEYDDEQVFTQATGAQLPLPEGQRPFTWEPFLARGQLASARNQSLVMVNKGEEGTPEGKGFQVCSRCGKTLLNGDSPGVHSRDYIIERRRGSPPHAPTCNGEFQRVYLGYAFSSDILLFRIPIIRPFRFDPKVNRARKPIADALQSLCEAVVLSVGRVLDIDIREINAGYRFVKHMNGHFADIFVYDTLSGGAGYATLAREVFGEVFKEVEALLRGCECSSSCDKCLRHYGNRLHHGSLDRFLALDVGRFIKEGRAPETFDRVRQQAELQPLAQMLSLAGWEISREDDAPIRATRDRRSIGLWSYSSLLDPKAMGMVESATRRVFSPYELSRDLPGAYAEVA